MNTVDSWDLLKPTRKDQSQVERWMCKVSQAKGINDSAAICDRRQLKQNCHRYRDEHRHEEDFDGMVTGGSREVHVLVAVMQKVLLPIKLCCYGSPVLPVLKEV